MYHPVSIQEQQDAVLGLMSAAGPDIKVSAKTRHRPKLTITGVVAGYVDQEAITAIYEENEDIREAFGMKFVEDTRIISKRKCRNEKKENIIIETAPEILKFIMRKGKIMIDLAATYVEEASQVTVCFNCHSFGHVQRYCTSPRTCQHCGGDHEGRQCKHPRQDCMNCRQAGLGVEFRKHSARDKKCPMLNRREKLARENTLYW